MMKNLLILASLILIFMSLGFVSSTLDITAFECPSEVSVGETFTCDVTVTAVGGSFNLENVKLYRGSNWLDQASYTRSQQQNPISTGDSRTISFDGMAATAAGADNGFSGIELDSVSNPTGEDTYVTSTTINAIDIVVITSNAASSAEMGENVSIRADVTPGGNLKSVTLTFAADSGGCSIINQNSSLALGAITATTQQEWTVTMGSSGDCVYTVSAAATGVNEFASKTDSVQNTIDCSDCPESSPASSSASTGGGGGVSVATLSELTSEVTYDLGIDEKVDFAMGGENHSVRVLNLTATQAQLIVQSTPQQFNLSIKSEKDIDFEGDGEMDLKVKLDSINILSKKAKVTIIPLVIKKAGTGNKDGGTQNAGGADGKSSGGEASGIGTGADKSGAGKGAARNKALLYVSILLIILIIIAIIYAVYVKFIRKNL